MRLFRRHFSDSSPRLVSLSPLCDTTNEIDELRAENNLENHDAQTTSQNTQKTYKNGLSTWSKKVGRKWDQLKRSDSTEFLSISAGRTGQWSPNSPSLNTPSSSETSISGTAHRARKRISRVESLRNLFLRNDKPHISSSSRSSILESDDESNRTQKNETDKSKFSPFSTRNFSRRKSSINRNINLSEKQLLEYLLLCQPADRNRIVQELLETISNENSKDAKNQTLSPLRNTYKKNFRSVKNFFKRSLSEGSIANNTITHLLSNQNISPSMDELCSVLNKILINSENSTNPDILQSSEMLDSCTNSEIADCEMRRSSSSGSFVSHINESCPEYQITTPCIPENAACHISERVIGPEDDTDSADDEMFTTPANQCCLRAQGSMKRLRHSSDSMESIHKRQIVKCSFKSSTEQTYYIDKEFKCIRLTSKEARHIIVSNQKSLTNSPSSVFVISAILPNCEAEKYGKICVGDTVVKINGKRLRGLLLEDVQKLMYSSRGVLELVISRSPKHSESRSPTKTVYPAVQLQIPMSKSTSHYSSQSSSGVSSPSTSLTEFNRQQKSHQNGSISNNCTELRSDSPAPTGMKKFLTPRRRSIAIEPTKMNRRSSGANISNRPKSLCSELKVRFQKGPGRKSLGFSVVGGSDSPRGNIGIYVKTVFAKGQASDEGTLQAGDEIISVNGIALQGLTHAEAINVFKNIKFGDVNLEILRRDISHHYQ